MLWMSIKKTNMPVNSLDILGGGMLRSRIDDLLWEKRMRPVELIRRSKLASETVLRARKDETISACTLKTLEAIAEALGVKIKDLFDEV